MSTNEQLRADVARLVREHFANRTPEVQAFLEHVGEIERANPGMCKFGVPAVHPLGPVLPEHADLTGFRCRGIPE